LHYICNQLVAHLQFDRKYQKLLNRKKMSQMKTIQAEKEVFIERIFQATPTVVFEAWTKPEHLVNWYTPDGCTIEFRFIEVKNGGSFHSVIRDPQHGDCWIKGIYHEVIFAEKLVFSMALTNEAGDLLESTEAGKSGDWPKTLVTTVHFIPFGDQTRLTLHQTVSEALAKETGAYQSWLKMFNRLDRHIFNAPKNQ
jgi:uncharacterized protein YndB with AHSA1/START domain